MNRKERSENRLLDLGIDFNPDLPPIAGHTDKFRSPQEIASKVLATWEVINIAQNAKDSDRKESVEFLKEIDLWKFLSPNEQWFLIKNRHDNQTVINQRWKTEAIKVFYWSLKELSHLGEPTEDDSLPRLSERVYSKHPTIDHYFEQVKLRSKYEILDEADYIYRLHWSSRPHRAQKMGVPSEYNYSVIRERDFAFRWLTNVDSNWDDISLDT